MTREILFKLHVTREFFSYSCVKLSQDPHCYPVRFTSFEVKLKVSLVEMNTLGRQPFPGTLHCSLFRQAKTTFNAFFSFIPGIFQGASR